MRWCRKCVETDTRPSAVFDEQGVCRPCRYVESLAHVDWAERRRVLDEIARWGRSSSKAGYDCIIGVSGGKDSTRQALYARDLGLRPLLVSCVYPPEQVVERGARNLSNLISLGFDTVCTAPAPVTSKALTKNCFYKFGNVFNATELALYASLPIMAIAYGIPLILLGENPGLAFGNDAGSDDYDGNRMKHMNTLKGGDPSVFRPEGMNDELIMYRYPLDRDMERAGLRVVYLGYFVHDFNDHTNTRIAVEHGLELRSGVDALPDDVGGISPAVSLDEDFVFVNEMLKYMKFGFGKATQEVGVAIRYGRMSRAEGVELVKRYDGKCHERYIERFARYIGVSVAEFWRVAESYRNHDIFEQDGRSGWKLKQEIT
jgi:N-acetyl sugar amidotransferase